MKIRTLLISLALMIAGGAIYASSAVSPALAVIASDLTTVKSVSVGSEVFFSGEDFDDTAGIRVNSITVLSLPEEGKLMLGDTPVSEGQIISHSSLDGLRYVFNGEEESAAFEYGYMSMGKGYTAVCEIYRLVHHNLPPIFTENDGSGYATVSSGAYHFGIVNAVDPESDDVKISVSEYPEHGVLTLLEGGEYKYKSDGGYTGNDRFVLIARDKYNNKSDEYTVNISVIDSDDTRYSDMTDSKAQSAAEVLSAKNIMSGYTLGNVSYFTPEKNISREEFIAAALSAAGISPEKYIGATAFADDHEIDDKIFDYIGYAFDKGWLDEKISGAVNYLRPKEKITYESALSFVYEMLGVKIAIPTDLLPTEELSTETAAMILERILSCCISQTK